MRREPDPTPESEPSLSLPRVESLELYPRHPLVATAPFRPYASTTERRAEQHPFDEPSLVIVTKWGRPLMVEPGDYIVSELDDPEDRWPVSHEAFDRIYREVRPGIYRKVATVELVPLIEITKDAELLVTVETSQGSVTVVAGDFYLARGADGFLWIIPSEKVSQDMTPVQ